jgi:hypothetical protein
MTNEHLDVLAGSELAVSEGGQKATAKSLVIKSPLINPSVSGEGWEWRQGHQEINPSRATEPWVRLATKREKTALLISDCRCWLEGAALRPDSNRKCCTDARTRLEQRLISEATGVTFGALKLRKLENG